VRNHLKHFNEQSRTLPANLPPRTSRWLIAIFGAGVFPLGIFAFGILAGTISELFLPSGPNWFLNLLINWMLSLTFMSWFLVQLVAFVGLTVRRDWALGMANLACLFWCFSVLGVIPAALVHWWLRRTWSHNRTGVAAEAPGSVEVLFTVTTGLVLGWLALVIYIDQVIHSIAHSAGDLTGIDTIVAVAFALGLPTFVLQGAALYGLRFRKTWGREAATVAAVVLMFTIVGIPFAYWALKKMWPAGATMAAPVGAPA
jgi:hypothetical protein